MDIYSHTGWDLICILECVWLGVEFTVDSRTAEEYGDTQWKQFRGQRL